MVLIKIFIIFCVLRKKNDKLLFLLDIFAHFFVYNGEKVWYNLYIK